LTLTPWSIKNFLPGNLFLSIAIWRHSYIKPEKLISYEKPNFIHVDPHRLWNAFYERL